MSIIRTNQPVVILDRIFSYQITHGLVEQAKEEGWQLLSLELTRGVIPSSTHPIGAILGCFPSDPLVAHLADRGCPTMFISGIRLKPELKAPYVMGDLHAAGQMAADHFADRNLKHLAYVGKEPLSSLADLFYGFKEKGERRGCKLHLLGISDRATVHNETDRMMKSERENREIGDWLCKLPKPFGLLGYHSWMAGRLCYICQERGLRIPEDVSVLSKDTNTQVNELAPVPLSSIDTNNERIGREAVINLKRIINGDPVPKFPVVVPPKGIVERRSTNLLAVNDPRVADAVRYLWDNLDLPITNEDVAREVNVPLSTLKRLFRTHLGRSITAELRRKRLDTAAGLLKHTTMTVAEIASVVGMASKSYLHRTFTREFGTTPNRFRHEYKDG